MATIFEPVAKAAAFRFDNSFARELQGFYVPQQPAVVRAPRLLFQNDSLAVELGLDLDSLDAGERAAVFVGNTLPDGAEPLAQAYAGHQFGGFSPQLGDGRALLLGEVIDRKGRRRDIAFKGSGRTPFARGGDGKAAVGPMLREVLIGEAMHALGIPTTRALAVAATGEQVYREYVLPGAVLTRVAETLVPLLSDDREQAVAMATEVIVAFPAQYRRYLLRGQRAKLGLHRDDPGDDSADAALVEDWLTLLHAERVDFTLGWRRLADAAAGNEAPLRALFADARAPDAWLSRWQGRCAGESANAKRASASAGIERAEAMRSVNPIVIARNHRVEEALAAASDQDDLAPFERLLEALRHPYVEVPEQAPYAEPAPAAVTACYRTFCGT